MPLRIAIDARSLQDFGIGTYIRNLVRALSKIDSENRYLIVTGDNDYPELQGLAGGFEVVRYPARPQSPFYGLRWPLFLRGLPADLYHIPLSSVPLGMPGPYLVTIHDLANILYGRARGLRQSLRLYRFRRGLLGAARVIAVSHATRRDVETLIRVPPKRIRTIYNAPDPAFVEPETPAIACIGEETFRFGPDIQRTLDRFHIHYPFLLYAGRTHPQKNVPRLVEAFAVLRGELAAHPLYKDLRLIVIGDGISRSPALRRAVIQSRVEHAVRFLGFVSIETLRVFYQAAAAFVFPSLYEGFGLPPLEAMACGAPVIASHTNALREVVGDAVAIVNAENVFDIARGMREVLLDGELRARLILRGFDQVKRFSWEKSAAQVLAVYREIAAPGARGLDT